MRTLPLSAEIQAVFARIRTYSWTLNVFGQSQSKAWRLVKARTERRINRAGLAIQNINVYRTYVHELVRAFRTEPGEPLVLRRRRRALTATPPFCPLHFEFRLLACLLPVPSSASP